MGLRSDRFPGERTVPHGDVPLPVGASHEREELDPSMVLGFYCRTRADFDSLSLELELLATRAGSTPILTVAPGPPPWDSDSDAERRDGGAGSDDDWELV